MKRARSCEIIKRSVEMGQVSFELFLVGSVDESVDGRRRRNECLVLEPNRRMIEKLQEDFLSSRSR